MNNRCKTRKYTTIGTVRWEAGPGEMQPKVLKTKLAQGEPSSLRPLRSDGYLDGQVGGWTVLPAAKDTQNETWVTTPGSQGTYLITAELGMGNLLVWGGGG
jgi:hypothetical protein